jgi:hypothetical protein
MTEATQLDARIWQTRAEQARRIAGMLSRCDADLALVYANECNDRARAILIEAIAKTDIGRVDRRQFSNQPSSRSASRRHAA